MNKYLRWLAWGAGIVAALFVVLVLAVWLLVDPDDYRPVLVDAVRRSTDRELALSGPLGLEVIPCCSLTFERASLGNPPGFPAGEFASVQRAELSLRLWPLLTERRIEVGRVRLEGLSAGLLVRTDGRANWEFDGGAADAADAADAGTGATDLAIDGVEIRGGRIAYRDANDASGYVLDKLELETGDVRGNEPFDFRLSGDLTDESDGTVASLALETRASVELDTGRLVMATPRLEISGRGAAIPAKELTATLGAAEVKVETEPVLQLLASDFQGEFTLPAAEDVAGDVEGSFVAPEARFTAGASTEVSMPKLSARFTATGKEIPGDTVTASLEATALSVDVDKSLGAVESLSAQVNGLGATLDIRGGGRITEEGADLAGKLTLAPVSPRSLLAVLKEPVPETADPKALTQLAGTADWLLAKDAIALTGADFRLDDTRITGSLGFAEAEDAPTTFDLRFDAIDLDRYLEPEAAGEGGSGGGDAGKAPAAAEEDIPVDTLRDLQLDGSLRFGKVTYEKLKLANVSARIRASGGRVRLDPLSADLYGGRYGGSIAIDATGKLAGLALEQRLDGVKVEGPLRDVFETDKLAGALSGRVTARATGNTSDALLRTMDGNVALNLADGIYRGTDLWHEIRAARARFRGEAPPPAPAQPQTRIEKMEFVGDIADGVMVSDRLVGQIPFIRMSGQGSMNLVDETLDYRLQAEVFETPTFEDGTTIGDLTGLAIPLTLKGAMADPSVRVDIRRLASSVAKGKLKERLLDRLGLNEPSVDGAATGTTQPPAEEKPRDALKRSLRDLLGR